MCKYCTGQITKPEISLVKYSQHHVPDESTLRKKYVDQIYNEVMAKIRLMIVNNLIYVQVDKTINSCGKLLFFKNLISYLNSDYACKS